MKAHLIGNELAQLGRKVFEGREQGEFVPFTNHSEADELLNDLSGRPHAFVLGCIMDRQIKAERAWLIPYLLTQRDSGLTGFSIEALNQLSLAQIKQLMSKPEPLHRYVDVMSGALYSAIQRIGNHYGGDAGRIWAGRPSSAEVVYRFLEFDGVGPKIATMAANILARRFKIEFSDYTSIDISADVHIRRVFHRLGLCPSDASVEQVVYKARSLHPEFPGMMDLACWEIGRQWCKPQASALLCSECWMRDLCPTAAISP